MDLTPFFCIVLLKNLYRIRIKVRWCRDSILWKKFWKFIPHTFAHPCTPTHICSHPPIPTNTHPNLPTPSPYQPTPAYTYAHLSMLHTHPRSPAHTCAYLCTPTFTCTHPRTPQTCPLMLILVWSIICKLANTKKARRYKERKRKEQESAEAFQRTKNYTIFGEIPGGSNSGQGIKPETSWSEQFRGQCATY